MIPLTTTPLPNRSRLLARRLVVHLRLRLIASAALAVGTLVARFGLDAGALPTTELLLLSAAIAVYDSLFFLISKSGLLQPKRLLYHSAWVDFLALAVLIWLVGGVRSPFLPFFLLHLVVSSLILTRKATLSLGLFAVVLLAGILALDLTGLAPAHPLPGDLVPAGPLPWGLALTLLLVWGAAIFATLLLFATLSMDLRGREERLIYQSQELQRLDEARRDFLRVATHNMRSPIGAARMFLTNLDANLAGPLNDQQRNWVQRAGERLASLDGFLSEMSRYAALEAGQFDFQLEPVDVGAMLRRLRDEYLEAASQRDVALLVDLPEELPHPLAMPRLLLGKMFKMLQNVQNLTKFSKCGKMFKILQNVQNFAKCSKFHQKKKMKKLILLKNQNSTKCQNFKKI